MSGRSEDPVEIDDEETNGPIETVDTKEEPALDDAQDETNDNDEDNGEYVVEAIRARRRNPKSGQDEYNVKWEGYPETENTWEPAENLKCPEIVQKFLEQEANKRKRKKVEKNHANNSKSQPLSSTKRPRRADTSKSKIFIEDESTEEEEEGSVIAGSTQKQKQTTREPTPEPVLKGFARGLQIDKIISASVGDDDRMYFFVRWQGQSDLELLEVDELEKNASHDLCRWYREKFFCNIKYKNSPEIA